MDKRTQRHVPPIKEEDQWGASSCFTGPAEAVWAWNKHIRILPWGLFQCKKGVLWHTTQRYFKVLWRITQHMIKSYWPYIKQWSTGVSTSLVRRRWYTQTTAHYNIYKCRPHYNKLDTWSRWHTCSNSTLWSSTRRASQQIGKHVVRSTGSSTLSIRIHASAAKFSWGVYWLAWWGSRLWQKWN